MEILNLNSFLFSMMQMIFIYLMIKEQMKTIKAVNISIKWQKRQFYYL